MLAIGPEPLNVIFAILVICTTTALPVGNLLKAMTIVLLARENVWYVLRLLKNKSKKFEIESGTLTKIRLGYPTSPKMNPNSWESQIRVIFLKVPSKSSNRQLKAFINLHPNPAMSRTNGFFSAFYDGRL